MKLTGIPGLAWALGGLVVGAAGGFWIGRQGIAKPEWSEKEVRAATVREAGSAGLKNAAVAGSVGMEKAGFPVGETPQQTLRNILAISDPVGRLVAMREWCRTVPIEEMPKLLQEFDALMAAREEEGGFEAEALFSQVGEVFAQSLFERGPGEVLAVFLATGAERYAGDAEWRQGLGLEVYKRWSKSNPADARKMLEARLAGVGEVGEAEKQMSRHLMRSWIREEPDAAMGWLLKQPEKIETNAFSEAFRSLSQVDPDKARELLVAQAYRPGRAGTASALAIEWAKSDPVKAMEWVLGLPEKMSGEAVKGALQIWTETDFPAARQAVEGMSAPAKERALPMLLGRWPSGADKDAAAFLEHQPEGTGKQEATRQLIMNWAKGDQQAASAWLARQPVGPARDAGAAILAAEVRDSDPEAAAVWGATLTDPAARQASLKATFQSWMTDSLPAALKWLETSPNLTEADRAALLGTAPER